MSQGVAESLGLFSALSLGDVYPTNARGAAEIDKVFWVHGLSIPPSTPYIKWRRYPRHVMQRTVPGACSTWVWMSALSFSPLGTGHRVMLCKKACNLGRGWRFPHPNASVRKLLLASSPADFPLKYRKVGTLVLRDISQKSLPGEPKC